MIVARLKLYAAAALAAAAFVACVFLYGRRSGAVAAQTAVLKKALDNVRQAQKVRTDVDRLSDDDVDRRLRERWRR